MYASPTSLPTSKRIVQTTLNGRGLKRRRLTRHQRADLAAELVLNRVQLVPSIGQAAELLDVPIARVREHLRINGRTSSVPSSGKNGQHETLADHLLRSTPEERRSAASALGVTSAWDEMVVPLITTDRAAE